MKHPTAFEIEEHLSMKSESEIRAHLNECAECGSIARSFGALKDPLTWAIVSLPSSDDPWSSIENESAQQILEGLREAESLRHVDPGRAVEICDRLLALPECAPREEEGRHLSVLLLRERANALRFLGELTSALETVGRARALADELLVSDYENAVLDYIEATVLIEQDQLDDAIALSKRAEATLALFGDQERANKTRLLVASVHYVQGDYEGARTGFLGIIDSIGQGESPAMRAGLLNNLADCEINLGMLPAARAHIREAAELYQDLGMSTELTRLTWLDARMSLATNDEDRAEELFVQTESEFAAAGLKLDAALVSLELVELFVRQGRREQVVEITSRLASVFSEAGAQMGLATALATLREAAVRGDDVSLPVARARTTIEELMTAG